MSQVEAKASIGAKELTAMLTVLTASQAFLSYPTFAVSKGYGAAWMEPLISGAVTIVLFLIVDGLLRKYFPGMDILEVAKRSFGKYIAALVSIVVSTYLLVVTAAGYRELVENVMSSVLPYTPIVVVGGVSLAASAYVAATGLEGIARTSYILLPVFVAGILGVCLLTINWWHIPWMLPFWGSGAGPVMTAGVRSCSIFISVLLLCIIYPHSHDPKSLRVAGVISIGVASALLSCFILVYTFVFPAPGTPGSPFPLYQLSRLIYIGRFMQRTESVFVFMWASAAITRLAVMLWAASYILASTFRWPTFRPVIPGMTLIAFSIGMLPQNIGSILSMDEQFIMNYAWLFNLGLPVVVVCVGAMIAAFTRRPNYA